MEIPMKTKLPLPLVLNGFGKEDDWSEHSFGYVKDRFLPVRINCKQMEVTHNYQQHTLI